MAILVANDATDLLPLIAKNQKCRESFNPVCPHELLAGIGLEGTMTLPWQLIMNFEAGYAVAGPGKGNVALRVFFLKLFPGS